MTTTTKYRSKRLKEKVENSGTLPDEYSWCRKCGDIKRYDEFFPSVDTYLDAATKVMSVCRLCCNTIFDDIYAIEKDIQKTVLKMCRMLNIKYDDAAIVAAQRQADAKNGKFSFGIYKAKLAIINRVSVDDKASDLNLTYQDNPIINFNNELPRETVDKEVIDYWGRGYTAEEYEWLEKSLDEWKKTHKCDTRAEEILLREIVFKQLEIEKTRGMQGSTASSIKELQDLMKTANVDPAKTSIGNSGKSQETFSAFVKIIEENEPAEYYGQENKQLFKDFDNIEQYFTKFVTRPLKNFITGSRDFNVDGDTEDEFDDADVESLSSGETIEAEE